MPAPQTAPEGAGVPGTPRVMDARRAHKTHGREEEQDGENLGVCPRVPPPSPRGAPQTQLAHTVPPPRVHPFSLPRAWGARQSRAFAQRWLQSEQALPFTAHGGGSWEHLGAAGDTWGQQAERLVGKTEGAAAGAPWGE